MMRFKPGQKVGIIGNIPRCIQHHKRRRGVVTRLDGEYVYVRPNYYKHEAEFYPGEIVHEWDARYG